MDVVVWYKAGSINIADDEKGTLKDGEEGTSEEMAALKGQVGP